VVREAQVKIAVIGAGGVRTPLILKAFLRRQDRLAIEEVHLMDIDAEALDLIAALHASMDHGIEPRFSLITTTRLTAALQGADYVITTFRVGGMQSRIIDEHVPLQLGLLGQETTGAGGFAMAMRSIPVLLGLLQEMKTACPDAWLVNFANPAGLLAQAAVTAGGWPRAVGICDGPSSMQRVAAGFLGVPTDEVFLDYFGLNHLGWVRAVYHRGDDYLPQFISMIQAAGGLPGLPFAPDLIAALGMIPNEYLYYYYSTAEAVENILRSEQTRGEFLTNLTHDFTRDLRKLRASGGGAAMAARYYEYRRERSSSYMAGETGRGSNLEGLIESLADDTEGEGYAGVALDLIERLSGAASGPMIINIPNAGAVLGMQADDVVEIPAWVSHGLIRPMAVGAVPEHTLGLMASVKAYERLTVEAAVEGSYAKALEALTLHPLVREPGKARAILDGYRREHGATFPALR
jgi:6-phospho-beta-glucosidase